MLNSTYFVIKFVILLQYFLYINIYNTIVIFVINKLIIISKFIDRTDRPIEQIAIFMVIFITALVTDTFYAKYCSVQTQY